MSILIITTKKKNVVKTNTTIDPRERRLNSFSLSAKREAEEIFARQKARLTEAYKKYAEENEYIYWDDMVQASSDKEEWLRNGGNDSGNHIIRRKNKDFLSLDEFIKANGDIEKGIRMRRNRIAQEKGFIDYYDYLSSFE